MDMYKVVCSFSPYYEHDGKTVYQVHCEDRTDMFIDAYFDLRLPSFEILEENKMNPKSQEEIIDFIKDNFKKIDSLVEPYQGYEIVLGSVPGGC